MYGYVLFMANTGLRPDEASNLEHRDVEIVIDDETGQRILEIEVRGKRGVAFCKSMPNAVRPYERLLARPKSVQGETRRQRRRRQLDGIAEAPETPSDESPKQTEEERHSRAPVRKRGPPPLDRRPKCPARGRNHDEGAGVAVACKA